VSVLAEVEARLTETRDRIVAALETTAAGQDADLSGLAEVVDDLCRDVVRLPPKEGRPLADALLVLIKGLDELENRLRQAKARASGRADAVPGRAARAYGRSPGS
jgi:hypothetical protein